MNVIVKKGISERQIDQLIEYTSNDENIKKFTSDEKRFKDKDTYNDWLKKGREIFTLVNENDDLLGIFWMGQKEMPEIDYKEKINKEEYKMTFGIRIYGEARGKGLAVDFLRQGIKSRGFWLETSDDNVAAKKVYEKFGFRQISDPDENNKIIMIY